MKRYHDVNEHNDKSVGYNPIKIITYALLNKQRLIHKIMIADSII